MADLNAALEKAKRLESQLVELTEAAKGLDSAAVPPVWSGSVQDLEKFVAAVRACIDDPKLERARRVISQLVGLGGPGGVSPQLSDPFLVTNLALLERIWPTITSISEEPLRREAANDVLTVMATRPSPQEIEASAQRALAYWLALKRFQEDTLAKGPSTSLLNTVRASVLERLSGPQSFELTLIEAARAEWTQAINAETLAGRLSIGSDVLASYYREKKALPPITAILEEIRIFTNRSLALGQIPAEVQAPPVDFRKTQADALARPSLEAIRDGLRELDWQAAEYLADLERRARSSVTRSQSISRFVELPEALQQELVQLESLATKNDIHRDAAETFDFYRRSDLLERAVRAESTQRQNLTPLQQEILGNEDEIAAVRRRNPRAFWTAVRGIVDHGLAEVRLVVPSESEDGAK